MELKLNSGDVITIPDDCKAVVKDKVITIEKAVQEFKDGDFVYDGVKVRVLSWDSKFVGKEGDVIKVLVQDLTTSMRWQKDFNSVQYRSIDFVLETVYNPIWLPIGIDLDTGYSQIDNLLFKKLGINVS